MKKTILILIATLFLTSIYAQDTIPSFLEQSKGNTIEQGTKENFVFVGDGECYLYFNGEAVDFSTVLYSPFVTDFSFVEEFEGPTDEGDTVVVTAFYKDKKHKKLKYVIYRKDDSITYIAVLN